MKHRGSIRARLVRVVLVGCALWLLPVAVGHAQGIGSAVSPAFALDTRPGLDVTLAGSSLPLKLETTPSSVWGWSPHGAVLKKVRCWTSFVIASRR